MLSSIQIGEGVRIKICKHENCAEEDHWDSVVEILGPYNSAELIDDLNDWASHVFLFHYDPNTEKYVQAFGSERFEIGYAGIFPEG